jgi:uncharacterized cupin superfamily protein
VTVVNLRTAALDEEPGAPAGRRCRRSDVGAAHGATLTGLDVWELPPGEAGEPYHYELEREVWLVVVAGAPTVRTPAGERRLRAGDVECFPVGPAGAHELRNDTDEAVRLALASNRSGPAHATVQPGSDKLHVSDGGRRRIVRASPELDFWDGEA